MPRSVHHRVRALDFWQVHVRSPRAAVLHRKAVPGNWINDPLIRLPQALLLPEADLYRSVQLIQRFQVLSDSVRGCKTETQIQCQNAGRK